jgi:hypothetical protein
MYSIFVECGIWRYYNETPDTVLLGVLLSPMKLLLLPVLFVSSVFAAPVGISTKCGLKGYKHALRRESWLCDVVDWIQHGLQPLVDDVVLVDRRD